MPADKVKLLKSSLWNSNKIDPAHHNHRPKKKRLWKWEGKEQGVISRTIPLWELYEKCGHPFMWFCSSASPEYFLFFIIFFSQDDSKTLPAIEFYLFFVFLFLTYQFVKIYKFTNSTTNTVKCFFVILFCTILENTPLDFI